MARHFGITKKPTIIKPKQKPVVLKSPASWRGQPERRTRSTR
jgi:hypothetical protein